MKAIVTLFGHENEFGEQVGQDTVVEFNDVKEIHRDANFFTVIKENGEQHACRLYTIKKFSLI